MVISFVLGCAGFKVLFTSMQHTARDLTGGKVVPVD
jgi:hypothetical protein